MTPFRQYLNRLRILFSFWRWADVDAISDPLEGLIDYVPEAVQLTPAAPYWRTFRPDYDRLQHRWAMWLVADTHTRAFVCSLPYFEQVTYDASEQVYTLYFTPNAGRDQESAENAYNAVCVSLEARFQAPIGTVETLGAFREFIDTLELDRA